MVLKNLTQEQKDKWKNICSDIIEQMDVLENAIKCDKIKNGRPTEQGVS
jgi:hypothetical protein